MVLGPDFQRVLEAAKSGAEWAWAAIYRDLAGPVKGYFVARGAYEAEDLASETFLQVARDIGSFRGEEQPFRSWVFVIAHRRLVDSWRASGRRPQSSAVDETVVEMAAGDTEEEAMSNLAMTDVMAAMAKLTEDQRAVLALRIVGGLSAEETAQVLGRRAGAVRALQHRGLLSLRRIIEGGE